MSKIATKIYQIDSSNHSDVSPRFFIEELIKEHNETSSRTQYDSIDCAITAGNFSLLLYVHKADLTPPGWHGLLMKISGNNTVVKNIKSRSPSFILFFYNNDEAFVITGGGGYRVVEKGLDSQFGFKVVERLIDTSKDDIRGLSQRVFLGIELASNRFFKADYVFEDEDNFGKYYRGLDVFIDSKKLESIGVITNKKKLLVSGELGFKINSKISFEELSERIGKIAELLKEESEIELNPFKKLTRWELKKRIRSDKTIEELLNQYLANEFFDEFEKLDAKEIYHPKLMEYLHCSAIYVKLDKEEAEIETMQTITPRLILGYLNVDLENLKFPRFIELINKIEIWIVDEEKNQILYPSKLLDWFYGEVSHGKKKYLKFENEWFNYSIKFSENLNERLDAIGNRVDIQNMDVWTSDFSSEATYNDSYSKKENFIVGDNVFHKKIEIADLISWTENELIIYHVKDGLGRNLRVLQSQIINSAKIISELKTDPESETVKLYHNKLVAENAKYGRVIPDLAAFQELIRKRDLRLIFGFATKTANNQKEDIINEIKSSQSSVAKIAILHSYYTIKTMGHNFSIGKISRQGKRSKDI